MARLTRFVMRHGADPLEAADAAQTAFTVAFPKWETIERPAAWLRKVAVRQYLRQPGRLETPVGQVPDAPGGWCPLERAMLKDQERDVLKVLGALPMQQRQVLAWHLDGFAHAEIAVELGMTREAVRQNLSRARAAVRRALGPADGAIRGGGR
ncbi:sigma-70 family RNA polymerase sigma factor [Streptomyces sp. MST-110588]|nr:sigma-70 family RNA polymerase sigma factor [Streptomyces sp. MST-110588]